MAARITSTDSVRWWLGALIIAGLSVLIPLPEWFVDQV